MSSNAFSNGANQNCGNVLTDRSTTRLHAPPGGASSFGCGLTFGGEAPAPTGGRGGVRQYVAPVQQQAAPGQQAAPVQQQPQAGGVANIGAIQESSNKFANGANQNCGNVLSERSSTRLHAPPGGQSSIMFG
jgi:SPIRAL1-like protein